MVYVVRRSNYRESQFEETMADIFAKFMKDINHIQEASHKLPT